MKKNLKTITIAILLTIITIFTLTGCQNNEVAQTSTQTSYPFEYTDGYGDTTKIEKEPERIVSVSPNITEILCSIGLENKIVGRTDFCDYPETVTDIQSIGEILTPNIEKITELQPDLVISEGMQSDANFAQTLRNLGIPVINIRANANLEGTYKSILDIGAITGANQKAEEVVNSMKSDLEKIAQKLENIEKKTVFYVVGYGEYGLSTATGDTYINELIQKAGLINIAEDGTNWSYSVEKLYEKNPEIIICSKYYDTKTGIQSDSSLKNLDSIKEGRIIEIDNNAIDRQTARNIDGIKDLVKQIYDIEI